MNLYLIGALTWLVSLGATGWIGYSKGHAAAENAARAAYATQLETSIAEHRADALVDMEAAREAGERDVKAKTRTVTVTNEVERIIHAKPAPADCRMQPDAFRLLAVAVEIANGADPGAALGVPAAGPATKPAGKP